MQNFHSMYKLTKFIGSGFRSKIYTCKELQSGKYFACKVVVGDNVNKTKSDENYCIYNVLEGLGHQSWAYFPIRNRGKTRLSSEPGFRQLKSDK